MSQYQFSMNPKVNDPHADVTDSALGAAASEGWGTEDVGKVVKLSVGSSHELAAKGDEIEGVLVAIEPHSVNSGFGFGSVQRNKRFLAKVDAAQTGSLAIGALVVAGTQNAIGTKNDSYYPVVEGGAPTTWIWRIVAHKTGTGAAGDIVVIERVNG